MKSEKKIVKRKLSHDVRERLMDMINAGHFGPGDDFPSERELVEQFGVGRPAVREALQSLQSAGFITVSQGQKPKFTKPTAQGIFAQIDLAALHLLHSSPSSLEHLKDARMLFETGIVRRAAENATKNDIERMHAALDLQEKVYNTDPEQFVDADMAFHLAIAEATKNPIFVATSQAMLGWLKKFHTNIVRLDGKEPITLHEHQRIFEGIEARDPDDAAYAMADHLNRSREIYKQKKR